MKRPLLSTDKHQTDKFGILLQSGKFFEKDFYLRMCIVDQQDIILINKIKNGRIKIMNLWKKSSIEIFKF